MSFSVIQRLPVSEGFKITCLSGLRSNVTLHRKVKTWPFGSAKWFWPSIFCTVCFAAVGKVSFTGEFSSNPFFEKYDFDLYEGFSILKNGPNSSDFEKKLLPSPDFIISSNR